MDCRRGPENAEGRLLVDEADWVYWVAVKELKLDYHNKDICMYTHQIICCLNYGNCC